LLERGEKRFERRSLLENLATALGCSVVDLTGQPYLPMDRASAEALATLPALSMALYDADLDDPLDVPARDVHELAAWATQANEHAANNRYGLAGAGLGTLLAELHVHAASAQTDTRRQALGALVETCIVASGTARTLGNPDLAVHAARHGQDAARRLGDPALAGFAAMTSASALSRLGARRGAHRVASTALDALDEHAGQDSVAAQAAGMLHLSCGQLAAKDGRADDAEDHLGAARQLAGRTGEANALWFSFGPANVEAWTLSTAVELERGPAAAEQIERTAGYDEALVTADRKAALHFDLARAYAQADGERDSAALRHLDVADRIAPQRIRHDPIAHELVAELDARTHRRTWELDSLKSRLGVGPGGSGR
jgi:hypothetical protein